MGVAVVEWQGRWDQVATRLVSCALRQRALAVRRPLKENLLDHRIA